jgi:hypothetical protein
MKAGGRIEVLAAFGSTSCLRNTLGGRTCDAGGVKDEPQHIKHVFRQNEYVIVTSDEPSPNRSHRWKTKALRVYAWYRINKPLTQDQ